ncbi:MAG: VCBS repeat-containing protein [Planctomycetes bacterium]|nr:VCBS repeat-containing protein [Planctomycetota bacterium]
MSPQFVDFDADGKLDIVAGIFDGSPHLVRGSAQGWQAPEQILDRNGARIVFNQFWNFDTKKWDSTHAHDAPGHQREGHLTSAVAFDWDGDGDLDLLLGDHSTGRVFLRRNEGSATQPRFATVNEPVLANGKPIDVPGTVATLRLVDWNHDGLLDLAAGGMGDVYGQNPGGGVCIFLNVGSKTRTSYAAPVTLLEPSQKGAHEPTRPDSGLYMDFGDLDADGDLDLIVGGYSHWTPVPRELSADEKQRATELEAQIAAADKDYQALFEPINKAIEGLEGEAQEKKYTELYAAQKDAFAAVGKRRQALQTELESLIPAPKRESFVWFYEHLAGKAAPAK